VVPLASIARLESGVITYTVGGNIYVRANDTSLQSAADLSGRKVRRLAAFWLLRLLLHRIPPMLHKDGKLQVTFASAGAAFTVLPWLLYEDIKAHGVDVFTDTAEVGLVNKLDTRTTSLTVFPTVALLLQIMLADNTDDTVYDLESGRTDAALLRADVLAHMEERGIINASSFKSLGSVSVNGSAKLTFEMSASSCNMLHVYSHHLQAVQPDYPYPVSTSLIPENVFIAAAKVPVATRKAVAQALYRYQSFCISMKHICVISSWRFCCSMCICYKLRAS